MNISTTSASLDDNEEGLEIQNEQAAAVSEDTDDVASQAPEASASINDDDDPETPNSNQKEIDINELMSQLEESIDAEKKRYQGVVYVLWLCAAIFLLIWIVGLPLAIAFTEDWTYQAAWYFSIQAGFGVGYGALTVRTQGMEIFLIIHLFLGAISISFLIAYLISRMIDSSEKKKKSKARITKEELGEPVIGWKSWVIGSILLLLVIVMGVLYGMLYEKWNFTESLYFIISTCQTSGLLAPAIKPKDPDNLFAPLFVSLLVVLAVPLWAYNIGKASVELVNLDRAQRRQSSVMERNQRSQAVFMRLAPSMGIDVSDPDNIQVNLAGFIVQLLVYHKMADEAVIKSVIDEFNGYMEPGGRQEGAAPQWKIVARVRFLQFVQLGMLEREDWQAFCDQARHLENKSTILHGSASKSHDEHESSPLQPPDDRRSWPFKNSKAKEETAMQDP